MTVKIELKFESSAEAVTYLNELKEAGLFMELVRGFVPAHEIEFMPEDERTPEQWRIVLTSRPGMVTPQHLGKVAAIIARAQAAGAISSN